MHRLMTFNTSRFYRLFLTIFCAIFVSACALSSPVPSGQSSKIIAMGDMHGDFDVYEKLMLASGLMDPNGNWAGGETIFVQTGDIPDRGPDTRKIIESLQKLEAQAAAQGGRVIPMVGNHEAMNMVGNLRYVHPGEFEAFVDSQSHEKQDDAYRTIRTNLQTSRRSETPEISDQDVRDLWEDDNPLGKVEHQRAWSPDGYIGAWVTGNLLVTKVDTYLFAHGGFSDEYTAFSLNQMNDLGQIALRDQDWSRGSILRHELGPLWYRGNVRGRDEPGAISREDEITKVLETYDATHIIIGHTRNEDGIRVSAGGRLIQIDTGASAHYGGVPSYLRIENGKLTAHTLDGVTELN